MTGHIRPRGHFVRHRKPRGAPLPGDRFGILVGEYDHQTLAPQGATTPDDNHVYLWLRVPDRDGHPGGVYECAFNIHSSTGTQVEFAELEEDLGDLDLPPFGFYPSSLSYRDLGVTDADFCPTRHGDLHVLVTHYAEQCDRVAAYGMTYTDGTGMHDIHMHHGSRPSPSERDGVLIFYFHRQSEGMNSFARWIFIKFASQHLEE